MRWAILRSGVCLKIRDLSSTDLRPKDLSFAGVGAPVPEARIGYSSMDSPPWNPAKGTEMRKGVRCPLNQQPDKDAEGNRDRLPVLVGDIVNKLERHGDFVLKGLLDSFYRPHSQTLAEISRIWHVPCFAPNPDYFHKSSPENIEEANRLIDWKKNVLIASLTE